MVETKLISLKNGIVIIECYPDGNKDNTFQLILDLEKKIILQNPVGKHDSYAIHAAWKVFMIYAETNTVPEKTISIWC